MDMYNYLPQPFLRRWGGCLGLPQHRWGPLGPRNTTVCNLSEFSDKVTLGYNQAKEVIIVHT